MTAGPRSLYGAQRAWNGAGEPAGFAIDGVPGIEEGLALSCSKSQSMA